MCPLVLIVLGLLRYKIDPGDRMYDFPCISKVCFIFQWRALLLLLNEIYTSGPYGSEPKKKPGSYGRTFLTLEVFWPTAFRGVKEPWNLETSIPFFLLHLPYHLPTQPISAAQTGPPGRSSNLQESASYWDPLRQKIEVNPGFLSSPITSVVLFCKILLSRPY